MSVFYNTNKNEQKSSLLSDKLILVFFFLTLRQMDEKKRHSVTYFMWSEDDQTRPLSEKNFSSKNEIEQAKK